MSLQEIIESFRTGLMLTGLWVLAAIVAGCIGVWLYRSAHSTMALLRRLRTWIDGVVFTLLFTACVLIGGTKTNSPPMGLMVVERTERRGSMSLCEDTIDQVEYLYNFIYFKTMRVTDATPDAQDLTAFKTRFKQVTGRSVRSAEQYETDSRRRTMKNIQEQKERDEAKRKRQEQQKRQEDEK